MTNAKASDVCVLCYIQVCRLQSCRLSMRPDLPCLQKDNKRDTKTLNCWDLTKTYTKKTHFIPCTQTTEITIVVKERKEKERKKVRHL